MPNNLLVAALRSRQRAALAQVSQVVTLPAGATLWRPGQRMEHAYFPIDCAIALLIAGVGEPSIEVGLIGREGLLGLSLALGARDASLHSVVQSAGRAWRVEAAWLRRQAMSSAPLRELLNRYAQVRMLQLAQAATCRSFHQLGARVARWLLMSRDRTGRSELALTHDLLAKMLGNRRAGVTLAANLFRERELISYSRGRIAIEDAHGLAQAACSCYLIDQGIYSRLICGDARAGNRPGVPIARPRA